MIDKNINMAEGTINSLRDLAKAGVVLKVRGESEELKTKLNVSHREVTEEIIVGGIEAGDCELDDDVIYYNAHHGPRSNRSKHDLLKIHPGHSIKFADLASRMEPVLVPDLGTVQGVVGAIQGKHFQVPDCDTDTIESDEALKPLHNSLVWIHYAIFLEGQDLPFDNSIIRLHGRPAIIKASPDEIFPGMAVAIRWMSVGQKARFLIPPQAHFGDMGLLDIIPPNTTILLLVHLLRYLDAAALERYENLEPEKKEDFNIVHPFIESINNLAKDYFFRKKISQSAQLYKQSIRITKLCQLTRDNKDSINALKVKTYVNLALCMDKLGNSRDALFYLDEASVLEDYMKNCKALFLRGRSHSKLSEYEDAKLYLLASLEMQPLNEEIGAELEKLEEAISSWGKIEHRIAKTMAGNLESTQNSTKNSRKLDEQFLSPHDREKMIENCKSLLENNVTKISVGARLLKSEIELLEGILKSNGGLELWKPDTKIST